MMERIEQLQDEVQGLQEFKQHKVCGSGACLAATAAQPARVSLHHTARQHTTHTHRPSSRPPWPLCGRRPWACARPWTRSACSWSATMQA
jgi:hypothetical protein